jgi:cytochrome c biogenesis protein CcmG/thiol:disulfide interchange protein DsbE
MVAGCVSFGTTSVSFGTTSSGSPGASTIVVGGGRVVVDGAAPGFSLTDLQGRAVRLADYAGRPVILNFWASWCIPCQAEFPMYLAARTARAAGGLEVLGVIYKDVTSDAARFMSDHGATWPALVDPDGAVARAYGVLGIPTTFFIDRSGVVRAVSYGPPPQQILDQDLAKIP